MAVDQFARAIAMDAKSAADAAQATADGKADLVGGKVPASQLPTYVDDVLEYSSTSQFPATGESGKIYVATDTNKTYRWGGSAYVEIGESLALGETSSTAYAGNKGKANADAIAAIKDGVNIDSFSDVETALAGKADVSDIPAGVTVDQNYNASSANAQSGIAVAQGVASVFGNGIAIEPPEGSCISLTNYTTPGIYHVTSEYVGRFSDFAGYPSLGSYPFVMIVLQGAQSGSVRHFYLFDAALTGTSNISVLYTRFKPSGGSWSGFYGIVGSYVRSEPT